MAPPFVVRDTMPPLRSVRRAIVVPKAARTERANKMTNITALLDAGTNVTLAVTATDLKEFALTILEEGKKMQAASSPATDVELTAAQVAKQLGVSTNSLWRWEKIGYLIPHGRIGKRPVYLQSQLEALKGGRK